MKKIKNSLNWFASFLKETKKLPVSLMAIGIGILSLNGLCIFAHPFTEETLSPLQFLLLGGACIFVLALLKEKALIVLAFVGTGITVYALSVLVKAVTGSYISHWGTTLLLAILASLYVSYMYPFHYVRLLFVFSIGAMAGSVLFKGPEGIFIFFYYLAIVFLAHFLIKKRVQKKREDKIKGR
jgi:hypothetical protein